MNKDNIESSRIEGLIPQQLLRDANALVEFLKEYYKFTNQQNGSSNVINNLLENRDLDLMVDSFVDLVYKEVGYGIAKRIEASKRNLYKHIGEFYRAKGSIESFKLLFRILFNTEIEIRLPKEQILIASDGRWSQQNSLFVNVSIGDGFDLYGRSLTINIGDRNVLVEVNRVKRIRQTNNYEISITQKGRYTNIPAGTLVYTEDGIEFEIINSLNLATQVYAGAGFEVGQIFDITDGTASGTKIKIASVDVNGSITKIDFLQFEPGYTSDFTVRLVPQADLLVGDPDVIVSADPDADEITYPNQAIYTFKNSTLAQYSGKYINNKGFLSDDIYLQDNYFYQQYSYVIRSGQQFDSYSGIVKKTVHPSGMLMFGEFEINNRFDLARTITSLLRYYRERFYDPIQTSDNDLYHLTKPEADTAITTSDDIYTLIKPLTEELDPQDRPYKKVIKRNNDSVTVSQISVVFYFGKNINEIINTSENVYRDIDKPLLDAINSTDGGTVEFNPYSIGYFAADYVEGITAF